MSMHTNEDGGVRISRAQSAVAGVEAKIEAVGEEIKAVAPKIEAVQMEIEAVVAALNGGPGYFGISDSGVPVGLLNSILYNKKQLLKKIPE